MITKGYKQTLKTRRRLSFSISIPSLHSTSLSNLLVGGSSGGLGHLDTDWRSVDQSDPFHLEPCNFFSNFYLEFNSYFNLCSKITLDDNLALRRSKFCGRTKKKNSPG
ncbi:hypothetical protein CsSME_00022572 [Camellia sinensis var. sinensis]